MKTIGNFKFTKHEYYFHVICSDMNLLDTCIYVVNVSNTRQAFGQNSNTYLQLQHTHAHTQMMITAEVEGSFLSPGLCVLKLKAGD